MRDGISVLLTKYRSYVIAGIGLVVAGAFLGVYVSGSTVISVVLPYIPFASTFLIPASTTPMYEYLEVVESCDHNYIGECVHLRTGPGTQYASVAQLRVGIVLRVEKEVVKEDRVWLKITFDNVVKFPDRMGTELYVAKEFVRTFEDDGNHNLVEGSATTTKRVVVDVSDQLLYAYDGDILFMQESISTGLDFTPTPRGTFSVFKMTPARYMQGPLEGVSDQVYDLPGVPWNLYFTADGAVIHGAYWHNSFGRAWSHGCVNLPPQKAKQLYEWAVVGTKVIVRN